MAQQPPADALPGHTGINVEPGQFMLRKRDEPENLAL
jgi:hypothetical protein